MIRHVFKLIWNRKMRNFLLISEIFFSFLVLFAVGTMTISNIRNYLEPLGFNYKNVLILSTGWNSLENKITRPEIVSTMKQVYNEIKAAPEVVNVSWVSGDVPYVPAMWSTSFEVDGQEYSANICMAGDDYDRVLDIPILEGRWFSKEDDASSREPIVIEQKLRETVFGDEPVLGKVIPRSNDEFIIVGVAADYHFRGEFMTTKGGFFKRHVFDDSSSQIPDYFIFSVTSGTGVEFEDQLMRRLGAMAPGWNMKISGLEDLHALSVRDVLMGMLLYGIVAGFLIFNVALGIFGVLWYSINRRRGEIGLRRAVGADSNHIFRQITGEALALATFGIIVGTFVAIQAPLLQFIDDIEASTYILAVVFSAGMIYLIITICALYPSRLATRIQPAEALHDE
ncbi:MAG: FtsX-like permease family protein [Candidatus Zixiibacteriota bacterium]